MASAFGDVPSGLYLTPTGFSGLLADEFDPAEPCFSPVIHLVSGSVEITLALWCNIGSVLLIPNHGHNSILILSLALIQSISNWTLSVKANPDQDMANQILKQLGKSSCYIGGYFSMSEHPRALQGPENHRINQSLEMGGISLPVAQHTRGHSLGREELLRFLARLKPSHGFSANTPWGSPVTNWKSIKQPWINKGKGQLPGTPAPVTAHWCKSQLS